MCLDKKHFDNWSLPISYDFNSRGFRDVEWPETGLDQAVWCIGDSFTEGMGSPVEHSWPWLLQQRLQKRTVNVSFDGASNAWIARRTKSIAKHIKPKNIVVQWTYLFRDEDPDITKTDEDRRISLHNIQNPNWSETECIKRLTPVIQELSQYSTNILHSFIPDFARFKSNWTTLGGADWPAMPVSMAEFDQLPKNVCNDLENFNLYEQYQAWCQLLDTMQNWIEPFDILDFGRDGHHYGLITAQQFVLAVNNRLQQRSV